MKATPLEIAIEALRDIARGRPELDDWGDFAPIKIAKSALRKIQKQKKRRKAA